MMHRRHRSPGPTVFQRATSFPDFGPRLREARRAAGLTQQQLATAAGVSRPTIDRLENGRATDIGVRALLRLLQAVGLDLRLTTLNRGRPTLDDLTAENEREP
jgi:transcriptional regulator with XRE-family HTH domain